MDRSSRPHAIIIGGSLSGLLAGLSLRNAGWHVEIYERATDELSGRGAGIVVQPAVIECLRSLGLDPSDLGVNVTTRKLFDADGCVVGTHTRPQILASWERLFRVLRNACPSAHYHRGKEFRTFSQNDGRIIAHFVDGTSAQAEILVGADGLRSKVRQGCIPEISPRYAGYVAWRGLIEESTIPAGVHEELFPYMSFSLPPGEQMLGYPVTGPDDGVQSGFRRYNVIWYRPAGERTELPELLTDKTGLVHAISIPPPQIRGEPIAEMRAAAERLLGPQFREIIRLVKNPILQPIYDLESPHMAFGRVALVGDAAFVARPHVAAGVSKAADDVTALVAALGAETDAELALEKFEAGRLAINQLVIKQARHLGAYLQSEQTAEERQRSQRHGIPEAVLRETAVLDFLSP